MIETIFQGIGNGATGFVSMLKNVLTEIVGLFVTEGGGGTYTLNAFGILTLAAAGVGIAYMAIRWVTRLVKMRNA